MKHLLQEHSRLLAWDSSSRRDPLAPNVPGFPQYWLDQPGSPKPERPDEEPMTKPYDELLQEWTGGGA
jgi:glycerol transport system substrate-binding protein